MLRWLAGLLLLANLAFWAWSDGQLDGWVGVRAQGDREPERLARQVRPESIRLVPAETAAASIGASAALRSASAIAPRAAATSGPASGASAAVRVASAAPGASGPGRAGAAAAASASVSLRPASAAAASVRVATAGASAASATATATEAACLEAGPFSPLELRAAQATLTSLVPAGRWTDRRSEAPGLWLIVMGRYADPDLLQKKKDEVAGIRVAFEDLHGFPDLEPGLLLGRFENRAAADAALAKSVTQGIRTARVVLVRPPGVIHHLRVPAADAELAARLANVKLGSAGRTFQGC